eukprot:3770108-Rhodomonas_salina.1
MVDRGEGGGGREEMWHEGDGETGKGRREGVGGRREERETLIGEREQLDTERVIRGSALLRRLSKTPLAQLQLRT